MSKIKDGAASRVMRGLSEVLDIAEGRARPARVFAPAEVDVKAIRRATGLSQEAFAGSFGFSLATLRDWEQRRRTPEGPARVLLTVIEREPDAVRRALGA